MWTLLYLSMRYTDLLQVFNAIYGCITDLDEWSMLLEDKCSKLGYGDNIESLFATAILSELDYYTCAYTPHICWMI